MYLINQNKTEDSVTEVKIRGGGVTSRYSAVSFRYRHLLNNYILFKLFERK